MRSFRNGQTLRNLIINEAENYENALWNRLNSQITIYDLISEQRYYQLIVTLNL